MANNNKYAGWVKEALTSEIKTRRAAGRKISVDLRADEDTLRAALDTDDVENGEFDANEDPKPPTAASDATALQELQKAAADKKEDTQNNIAARYPVKLMSQIAKQPEAPSQSTQPLEKEWAEGALYQHKGDKLIYQVVKRASDPYDKPVKARVPAQDSGHPGMFWEGTNEEFNANFEKV